MGSSALPLMILLMSFIHAGLTQDSSSLTVTPDDKVFTGETVTLTCVIKPYYSDWRYEWYKNSVKFKTSDHYTVNRDTLTIRGATRSDQDYYSCGRQRDGRPDSSRPNSVYLSVEDSPRSSLTVTPDSPVFTGETVNLKCVIESHSNWRYEWYKDTDSVMLQTSDGYTVNRDTLTIRGVITSDQGQYWCRGWIRSVSSQSNSVSLSVKDKPKPTLTVKPQGSVFTGDTVTLSCDVGQLTGWTIHWRKDSNPESTTDATKTIKSVRISDEGEYRCRARRGNYYSEFSNTVTITVTVRPKPVVGVDPDRRVFRGETVTLTCDIQQTGVWQYSWYKDYKQDYIIGRDQNYKIPSVDPSHRGVYSCRGTQTRAATHTQMSDGVTLTVSVSDSSSSLLVTAVVVGSSVFLLIFISLLLLWRYKKNKDQQRNINQTSVPNQSAEPQPENFPLQSADPDHVYDDVTEVKKRHKDDPETTEVTYSEILWSYVDKDVSMAESNDVTYSEVKKKVKKCKDADAGVGDATYASVRKKGP